VFQGWDNFYFLIGSAAGGLIGLLFVVVTLTSGLERSTAMRGASIYMTPTAVHFAAVLCVSAIALAPGLSSSTAAAIFTLAGVVGLANSLRACVGILTPQPPTAPHWSDLWMYGVTPVVLHLGLCAAALAVWAHAPWAADAMAGVLLAILVLAIRNAWDLVTWIAPMAMGESK
jgi:hypothetical protein